MTDLNALVLPGALGDRAFFSALPGNWRTNNGTAWWFGCYIYVTSLTPGTNMYIVDSRRASNNVPSTGLQFIDSNDRLRAMYNATQVDQVSPGLASAGTWYYATISNSGSVLGLQLRIFDMTGAVYATTPTSDTGSSADDSATQQVSLGARFDGSVTSEEWVGRIARPMFIWGGVPSDATVGAHVADPLNTIAEWLTTHGANIVAFGQANTDLGPNGVTMTLTGGVTMGSANGPTVPDQAGGGAASPTITAVGRKSLGVVFDLELAVPYIGTDFGTSSPLVQLTSDASGVSNLVTQTVRSFSDTTGTFDCAIGSLLPGQRYLKITNQTIGDTSYGLSGIRQLTDLKASSGPGVVATRRTIPTQTSPVSVAIPTFDGAGEFHLRNAQEALAYSVASGALPTGVTLNSGTGVAAGTIGSGAAAGSPYTAMVRATDQNGAFVDQVLSWIVGVVAATTNVAGSWGRRGRRTLHE